MTALVKKLSAVVLVLLVLTIVISQFKERAQSPSNESIAPFSSLNRGVVGEPETLDPHNFITNQAGAILRDIGEGLLSYSPEGNLVGGVAESWAISEDGLSYTFKLRENARWSNGRAIVAQDFIRSFRMLLAPEMASQNAHYLEYIQNARSVIRGEKHPDELSVESSSPSSLTIRLRAPAPFFLQILTHPSTFPIFDDDKEGKATGNPYSVTNGPYFMEEWVIGSEIKLRKNKHYWGASKVFFEEVVYHVVEEAAELNRFRAGEIDVTGNVPSGAFRAIREEFPSQLKVSPYLGVYYYGFNLKNPKFADNEKLRKALSLAVDRNTLVKRITARGEEPAFGWVPPGVFNYTSQKSTSLMLTDVERIALARRLFLESGYGDEKDLQLEVRFNESDVQRRIATAIQAMWRDVLGLKARLVEEEFKVLLSNIRSNRDIEVFRLSWTGDYNDAQTFLQLFESGNSSNMTGYSNRRYDDLMDRAMAQTDSDERRQLLEAAERLVLEDHAVIPLYFYVSKHLVSDRIIGWAPNVLDIHMSQHLRLREH